MNIPSRLSELVRLAVLGLGFGATTVFAQLTATPSTTEGPYYPFNSTQTLSTTALVGADNDLTLVTGRTTRASGTRFLLSGTLVNTSGTAISGATIELWQTDNNGVYYHSGNAYQNRDLNFQHYGTCTTDSSGAWSFRTVRPGLYTGRVRHFHYKVNVNGTTVLTSQFMFEEDRSSLSSDNVAAPLVSAGTINLTLLTPTSGVDSADNATALIASKQVIVNLSSSSSSGSGSSSSGSSGSTGSTSSGSTSTSGSSSSGGGGGGAPSLLFLAILATAGALRLRKYWGSALK